VATLTSDGSGEGPESVAPGAGAVDPGSAPTSADVTAEFWGDDEVDEPREHDDPAERDAPRGKRKAHRHEMVVRRVSPWSALKVSFVVLLALWASLLVAGAILWAAADQAGLVTNAENFVAKATGNESITWDGGEVLRSMVAVGAIGVVAGTLVLGLAAVLFNLVCDLTGGVRLEMLDLEPKPGRSPGRRRFG
jgi:hypothetical protein